MRGMVRDKPERGIYVSPRLRVSAMKRTFVRDAFRLFPAFILFRRARLYFAVDQSGL